MAKWASESSSNTSPFLGLLGTHSWAKHGIRLQFQALSKHANQIVHALPYAAMSAHTLLPRTAAPPNHVLGGSRPLFTSPLATRASLFLPV
jgi:hypothetical protein